MLIFSRRICFPKLAQLRGDLWMGGEIFLHLWVVDSRLVPLLDRVSHERGFLQRVAVEKLGDASTGRCAGQALIGNRADDLVTIRSVGLSAKSKSKNAGSSEQQELVHSNLA